MGQTFGGMSRLQEKREAVRLETAYPCCEEPAGMVIEFTRFGTTIDPG